MASGLAIGMYGALSGKLPQIFALNDTAKVWTLDTSTTADYTKSLTTIDNSGAQPTGGSIGANHFTNPDFASNTTSWNVAALPDSGWAEVPASATFGTDNFLVMQYEAKYDCTADGDGDTAAACSATADSGLGLDYRDLASFDKEKVVSSANGAPIVHITQTQALTACPSGTHLISNAEWMTIARNAEAQPGNWADGVVGSTVASGGGMFRGNVGTVDSVSYNGADPEYGTGRDTKARYTLGNGSEVWDLSGNVWNWNSDVQTTAINTTGGWVEWNSGNFASGARDLYGPSNASYLSSYGMGQVYGGGLNNALLRGGFWNDGTRAGPFSLYLSNSPGIQNSAIGFRCASDPVAISHSTSIKYSGTSSMKIANGSPIDTRVVQSANVGDTSTYTLITYAYTDGSAVTSADLELWYDSAVLSTTYTSAGGGWYQLLGTLTGVAVSKSYGVQIKAGKTVYIDNISLQAGIGTTQTFNVINSGTGTVKTNFEDSVTIGGGSDTQQLIVKANSAQTANLTEWQNSSGTVLTKINAVGVIMPVQATTALAPTYVKGGMYFDTTLNKMRIGGASAWETVTSI